MNSLVAISAALRARQCSAEELVRQSLDRLAVLDEKLHAFVSLDAERALQEARLADEARRFGDHSDKPFLGIPMAVKDNMCTAFGTTTCASRILQPFRANYNAYVVDRLEAAGAIILGKTNLDEFAMGSSTENSAFFTTRNPWDISRVAGGSSGGSAAAVAADFVPAALGSDTGGSVRLPAAFCGVVGLKPSYGRVSRFGLVAFGSSLDQIGPLTRTVEDAAWLLSVIAGHDPRDSTCVDAPVADYVKGLGRPLTGLRIGVADEHFGAGLDPQIRKAVQGAIALFAQNGATIVPIQLPHAKYAVACYYIVACAEASSNLARFDGVHYGYRTPKPQDVFDLYASSRGEGFGPEVKRRIMLGTYALSSGYYDAYYLKALKVRTLIKHDFDVAFEKVDLIACPVAPTTAFPIGEKSADPLSMYLGDLYTLSANLAGICAISVPCGADDIGLPIGLQLSAKPFAEDTLLAAAHQFQLLSDHPIGCPAL